VYAPKLPIDLLRRVFAPLAGDCETLSAAACMCRVWHAVALEPSLWRRACLSFAPKAARRLTDGALQRVNLASYSRRAAMRLALPGASAQRARRARCAGARGVARLLLEHCQHAAPPPRAARQVAHLTHLSAPSLQGCVTVCSVLLPQRTALAAWRTVGGEGERGASA
jgi:hypothetical protein